jgi:hypothetical protein
MVEVRRNEGVATRIGPEPCVGTRKGAGEASAGERIGQPLSRESDCSQGADAVSLAEGDTEGRDSASAQLTLRGLRPWHVRTLFAREPGDLQLDHSHDGVVRIGKARSRTCPFRASFIPGRTPALPSTTPGGRPVRESRPPGSVQGAPGNGRPYRDKVSRRILALQVSAANTDLVCR